MPTRRQKMNAERRKWIDAEARLQTAEQRDLRSLTVDEKIDHFIDVDVDQLKLQNAQREYKKLLIDEVNGVPDGD